MGALAAAPTTFDRQAVVEEPFRASSRATAAERSLSLVGRSSTACKPQRIVPHDAAACAPAALLNTITVCERQEERSAQRPLLKESLVRDIHCRSRSSSVGPTRADRGRWIEIPANVHQCWHLYPSLYTP
jgi:hypothetical protein